MEVLQDLSIRLLRNGFIPLRLEPDSKAARSLGWQVDTPTEQSLTRAFARPSNIGVRCGDMHKDRTVLLCIDIDLEDVNLIRCVERAIGVRVPVKRGKKGYTYFVRIDREHKSHKIYWSRDGKKSAAIDILCKGAQTVIPPSIHPETKQPYTWVAGTPIDQIEYAQLPVFTPALIDEIRGFCKNPDDAVFALNDMEWLGVGGGGNTHDVCVTAVASMVARKWTDEEIQERIQRAKREACEAAGTAYDWPQAQKAIQEWIDSCREKKFDTTSKVRVEDVPIELINRYVYVIGLDRMYDLHKATTVSMPVFNNVHARDVPKPWVTMMLHPDTRHVDRLTYSPGQPQFCREKSFDSEAVLDCLNVFYPSEIEEDEGDVTPFTDLVADLFDHDAEAIHHVTSFFAYAVQHPGERINHALVIQGEQGIGKDSLIAAIDKLLGSQNVSQVTLREVESQFNDWLFGKQLIVFQEMLATGRRNIYNKLKTYITDPLHTINAKHLPLQRVPNRAVYVFLTNYRHALSIDPSDRRMWVWYSQMERKEPAYYDRYYRWLKDRRSASALMHYLLNYDTSKFNPSAPPPMTDAKRQMVDASSSECEQFLREAVDNRSWPMACDLVSVPHVLGALRPFMRVSQSMIAEALDHIAPKSVLETRPWFGSQRLRLRAIRNLDKWKDASGAELSAAYRLPLPPQSGETEGSYTTYGDGDERGGSNGPDF